MATAAVSRAVGATTANRIHQRSGFARSFLCSVYGFKCCQSTADTSGKIVRVVDGDTYCIDLENVRGDEEKGTKVRLIGVDTPESVAPDTYRKDNTEEGKTVSDIVRDKLKVGDTVLIEYDVQKEDKYGRTLAYVYMSNGTMVEEWLLSEGLANTATYPPNVKYSDHFQELAHNAWENEVGLWKDFFSEEP